MKKRPEYNKKLIGENLRRCRQAKHLSVEQVRKYLRLGSVQAIYKWEEGASYPQTDTMFALMELYDIGLRDLLYGERPERIQVFHGDMCQASGTSQFFKDKKMYDPLRFFYRFAVRMVMYMTEMGESQVDSPSDFNICRQECADVYIMRPGDFRHDCKRCVTYFQYVNGSVA